MIDRIPHWSCPSKKKQNEVLWLLGCWQKLLLRSTCRLQMWRVSLACPGYDGLLNLFSNLAISFEQFSGHCPQSVSLHFWPLPLLWSLHSASNFTWQPSYVFDVIQIVLTMLWYVLIMELHSKPFRHGRYKSQEAKGGVRITDDVDRDFYRYMTHGNLRGPPQCHPQEVRPY